MTPRQEAFVAYKLEGFSNRSAVIAAGYSPTGAKQRGTQLMQHPGVVAELRRRGFSQMGKVEFDKSAGQWFAVSALMPRKVYDSAIDFLTDTMNCEGMPIEQRIRYAAILLPYQHRKIGRR